MARSKRQRISPVQFEDAVMDILDQYGLACADVLERVLDDATVSAVLELQSVRHFAPGGRTADNYAPSWTYENRKVNRFRTEATVYNSEHYRLTHLLEFGHIGKNGKRTDATWSVQAYPHIAPVNDKVQEEIVTEFRKRVEGGI